MYLLKRLANLLLEMTLASSIASLPAQSARPVIRTVDYLRISITDRCNERCLYCMPEQFSDWTPREEILTDQEIIAIVQASIQHGFKNFRITGGEPLLRTGVVDLIAQITRLPGVATVSMTTNGTRLPELAQPLFEAGLRKINISLDALDPDRYFQITRGKVAPVIEGIKQCRKIGFPSIKLNTVLMRGKNETEILPLIDFAHKQNVALRFIELMPLSLTEMLNESNFLPIAEVMEMIRQKEELLPFPTKLGFGPAQYYTLKERGVKLGFIGALTDLHFCDNCNKMRLTADGKIRPCLGNHLEFDLKPLLRPQILHDQLQEIFQSSLREKPLEHQFRNQYQPQRIMTAIGG